MVESRLTQKASRKVDDFIDRAQQLLEENAAWKSDVEELTTQINEFNDAIRDEPTFHRLTSALDNLSEDLGDFSSAGFSLLTHKAKAMSQMLYQDFYNVIIPRIIGSIHSVPFPRIEYVSESLDLVIDNFKLESLSFIPDRILFTNHNDLLLEQGYAAFATNLDSNLRLHVEGLRIHARDIAYYINSKEGWGWQDAGSLEFELTERGLCFTVELETAEEEDRESFFKVKVSFSYSFWANGSDFKRQCK